MVRAPLPRLAKFMVSSVDVRQGKSMKCAVPKRIEVARFCVDATGEEDQFNLVVLYLIMESVKD